MGCAVSCCEVHSVESLTIVDPAHEEAVVADCLERHAQSTIKNLPDLCRLEPEAFVEKVIKGGLAVDDGDWVQPLFSRKNGIWSLHHFEVLYRMSDAFGVPFPAFVNFVKSASDQCSHPDPKLKEDFRQYAASSLQRVDARLSQISVAGREAMEKSGIFTNLNFTAKQLDLALSVPLENGKLLAAEETEYDAPPDDLSLVRHEVWLRLGALSLDDVMPTLADVAKYADIPLDYEPPCTPARAAYKPLPLQYNHDLTFARSFIADFRKARQDDPKAKGDLKLDEVFCCYLIGVGHAPFARTAMAKWREQNPIASAALRRAGVELIREAMAAGMGIVLEVSFDDSDVHWLVDELPELENCLMKQGGRSGSTALPHSIAVAELLSPVFGAA